VPGAIPIPTGLTPSPSRGEFEHEGPAGKDKRERRVAQNGSEGPLLAGVAGRYALALYELARDERQVDDVAKNLDRAGISGLAANFIKLSAANRRLFALPDMIRAYREKVREAKGIVRAEVRVAEKPSDAVIEDIKASLRDVAKSEVDIDLHIDPSLIGGIVVKMGSRMVDASLRTKLNSIRLAMREAR
jgi:F-type H+-transporting ATPase subunit delta